MPGPEGIRPSSGTLDDGTLLRRRSAVPGPVQARLLVGEQSKAQSAVRPRAATAGNGATRTWTAEERVISSLRARSSDFALEGRFFCFIPAVHWPIVRKDESYQIVPASEANQVLAKLSAAPNVPRHEILALSEIADMLTDTVTQHTDAGILLLRKTPIRHAAAASGGMALTPSQLLRLRTKEKHWIEIELVDENGEAVAGEEYLIVTPNNASHSGVTDPAGYARLDGIDPGSCRVSFPRLDKDTWRPY